MSTLEPVAPMIPRSPRNKPGQGRKHKNSRVGNRRARYQAHPDGTVINLNTGRVVKGSKTEHGYRQLPTGRMKHQLIAAQLIENPHRYPEVNHKNGAKEDNRVDNLEWMTGPQNKHHYNAYLRHARILASLHNCPLCECPECSAFKLLAHQFDRSQQIPTQA